MSVWIKKPPKSTIKTEHAVIWPHELFAALFQHHSDEFIARILGGSVCNIKKFWDQMRDHPAYTGHPLASRKDHKEKCIPISLHGDGVPIAGIGKSWGQSVDAYSWNSLLGTGTTVFTNFLIYLMYQRLIIKHANFNVFEKFVKKLCWSLYWLFVGRWPDRDENGVYYATGSKEFNKRRTPLAGGYYCVLWILRGDLEHMTKAWGLPAPQSSSPCGLCRANSSDLPWTDGRAIAAWIPTIWTNQSWWEAHPERSPVFNLPGVGILAFVPDILHVCHLGVYMYIFGSILQYMTHNVMMGNKEDNLAKIWIVVIVL